MAIAFLTANMSLMARAKAEKVEFTDISTHWAKDVIVKMSNKGLIKGFGNGKFLPDEKMKRSEFVAALHKTLGIEMNYVKAPEINEFFDDVKNDDWFVAPLYDLAVLNIVDDRDEFRANAQITREEMVNYLINGYNYKFDIIIDDPDDSTDFSDDKNISKEYKKAVKEATKLGFVRGKGNNIFDPKGITTRAEALVVLGKLLENMENTKNTVVEDKEAVIIEPSYEKSKESFKMKLKIINNTDNSITIKHTSGQKFDFKLLDENRKNLYTWSMDKMFIMMLTDTVIAAGESIELSDELDIGSFGDIVNKAKYLQGFIVGVSSEFEIDREGYTIEIRNN